MTDNSAQAGTAGSADGDAARRACNRTLMAYAKPADLRAVCAARWTWC